MICTDEEGNVIPTPYHLQLDAPPKGVCASCGRKTWSDVKHGDKCLMPQSHGHPCPGRFIVDPR